MAKLDVSVVITTFNRSSLMRRAIQSVLDQDWPDLELLVVDDASSDDTPDVVQDLFPQARYLRQASNRGVCAARNLALRSASQPWVLFLDDDDTLYPNSLARVASQVAEFQDAGPYPVLQFACSNGRIADAFMIATIEDHLSGRVQGDFVPLIRREYFLSEGLCYPELRMASESLLWLRVAEKYGIPTWAEKIGKVHCDAALRSTSTRYQLVHAREFAEAQEYALSELRGILAAKCPAYYETKLLGAATYRLLADQRDRARFHLHIALRNRISISTVALWTLSFFPQKLVRRCFETYRRRQERGPATV